jgi:hypothetical protein
MGYLTCEIAHAADRRVRLLTCCAALAVLAVHAASAQEPVTFNRGDSQAIVTPALRWFEDPSRNLGFDDARKALAAAEVRTVSDDTFRLSPRSTAVWLQLTVANHSENTDFVLEFNNPRLPEIDVYFQQADGTFTLSRLGVSRPYAERPIQFPMPAAKLAIPAWETREIYLRVFNTGDTRFLLRLWDADDYMNHAASSYVGTYLMTGLLLAMVIFHLMIYFSLRESNYLYLSLFLTAWLLWYLAFTATGSALLWSDLPRFAERAPTVTTFLVCGTFAIFGNSLLEVHKFAPRWSRLLLLYAACCGIGIVLALLGDTMWRIYLAIALVAASPVLLILASLRVAGRGGRSARRFLLTWGVLHLGGVSVIVIASYFFGSEGFGATWINLVVVSSTLVWSFELTGRVKTRMREQQRLLEETVEERTLELRTALSEVKTLSGLLPMCASCKKIRDDSGYWNSVETFIRENSNADFTHGLCPDCRETLYPGMPMRKPRLKSTPEPPEK